MNKIVRVGSLAGLLVALSPAPGHAVLTFNQLDENTFTVSHRVKGFGSRGKATELVYTKAASLCVAAGYTHYQVMGQDSQASQPYQAANASLTLEFFLEDGENRISCEPGSDLEYVEDARAKLKRMGYEPPEPGQEPEGSGSIAAEQKAEGVESCPQGCTIEQIAAMARAGLSDEKIRAACEGGSRQGASGAED